MEGNALVEARWRGCRRPQMIAIRDLLADLAIRRPVFHSEADFQHAFAWLLHQRHPELSMRLEVPVRIGQTVLHVDLLAFSAAKTIAIELKYKTKGVALAFDAEEFRLANHGAQDLARYDFIKDIHRLEQLATVNNGTLGFAVLLTNDSSYWGQGRRSESIDAAFRLHPERLLTGDLAWDVRASSGTIRGREDSLNLGGSYPIAWRDYSELIAPRYGRFRYLAIGVGS
jgi:hypothetical protein